ncbi:MAG: hypothetical protein AAGC77_13110 [Pseudomonadota bacterium]
MLIVRSAVLQAAPAGLFFVAACSGGPVATLFTGEPKGSQQDTAFSIETPALTPFQWSIANGGRSLFAEVDGAIYFGRRTNDAILESLPPQANVALPALGDATRRIALTKTFAPAEIDPALWRVQAQSDGRWGARTAFEYRDGGFVLPNEVIGEDAFARIRFVPIEPTR